MQKKKTKVVTPAPVVVLHFLKEQVVKLLLAKVPGLFDRYPMGSMSRKLVDNLADEILKLK